MPRKMQSKKVHFSMQGRPVDFEAMRTKHEKSIAVGNTKTNARGDQLGKGGKIVKKRDEK
tara:strand:- start:329 stop:508 length:180 start_codon:yes stop_codon:yes gene_type:complete